MMFINDILQRFGRRGVMLLILLPSLLILSIWQMYSVNQGAVLSRLTEHLLRSNQQVGATNHIANNDVLSGVTFQQTGRGNSEQPWGNPLGASNSVMTQGYGVGSHAPAPVWGAVDLALDGDGDGAADPAGSWGQPIYATHAGNVKVTADSWPAGNHVWVSNDSYRTGYAHLQEFAVRSGDYVERGDLLGYMGSTGMSSGPHLDYQVWKRQGNDWVNVNPLEYAVMDR
jgi:murein DD-endopeptidase MepM/ murein hydrolase activator NlpD